MSHALHPSTARSDMDEIETLARAWPSQQVTIVPAARPISSPPRASIPVSSSSALPPATTAAKLPFSTAAAAPFSTPA
jgi:hypothetical protein